MRQGCPVNPLLFILESEHLACAVKRSTIIRGIPFPINDPETDGTAEVRINGYVDDTQLFGSTEESLMECFNIHKRFENPSGAKVNTNKTLALYNGSWRNKIPEFNEIKL